MQLLRVIGAKGPALGIGSIVIDGAAERLFDCYAVSPVEGVTLFYAIVSDGTHTVTVVADGTKNASSTGFDIAIDDPALLSSEALMGSLSTYARTKMTDHIRGVASYTRAATVYLRLFLAGTEVSGSAYAAKAITNNTTNFPNSASRTKTLSGRHSFVMATGTWQFDEVRLYDAAAAGNMLASHSLGATESVAANETYVFDGTSSEIVIVAAAGGLVDTQVHGILDHVFGGPDYTAKTDTYGAYYAGDPQGAGAQAGSRVQIVNDGTSWAAAADGVTSNLAAITLTIQPTATHWAEFDAAVAGNLLWSTTISGARIAPSLPISGLKFEFFNT